MEQCRKGDDLSDAQAIRFPWSSRTPPAGNRLEAAPCWIGRRAGCVCWSMNRLKRERSSPCGRRPAEREFLGHGWKCVTVSEQTSAGNGAAGSSTTCLRASCCCSVKNKVVKEEPAPSQDGASFGVSRATKHGVCDCERVAAEASAVECCAYHDQARSGIAATIL